MLNFIPDVNPFHLPKPPAWFLQGLYDFDPMLVLIPSQVKVVDESPAYLLCRRRQYTAGIGDVAMLDNKHPDTLMCYRYGVIPIGPLRFNNGARSFTQQALASLLNDLRARDTWAISGGADGDADKVWQNLEYQEAQQEQKAAAGQRDMFAHMARDAWRSIKARSGQRNKTSFDGNRFAKVGGAPQGQRKIIVS